jgi:hypothetical protein
MWRIWWSGTLTSETLMKNSHCLEEQKNFFLLEDMEITTRSHTIVLKKWLSNATCYRTHHEVYLSRCESVFIKSCECSLEHTHTHILLVHENIQMRVGLVTNHITGMYSKNTWSHMSWFYRPHEALRTISFVQNQFDTFTNCLACCLCSKLKFFRKTFYIFTGTFHQRLSKSVNVCWYSSYRQRELICLQKTCQALSDLRFHAKWCKGSKPVKHFH